MNTRSDARLVNLLGVVATGLTDQVEAAMVDAAQLDGTAPAALVALLDCTPNGSVDMLSRVVGLTHSGAVRLVTRMAGAGLVERSVGSDARSVTVTLTRRGKAVARKVRDRRTSEVRATLSGLSDEELDHLTHACERLVATMTKRRLEQRAAGDGPPGGALCRMCDFGACGRRHDRCPAAAAADASRAT